MKKSLTPFSSMFGPRLFGRDFPSGWNALSDMEKQMDRFFGENYPPSEMTGFDFSPACEVHENDNTYTFRFDVPGVKKEDISIELENNRLTISGERKEEKKEKDEKKYLSESYYGSFMRSFTLPGSVKEEDIQAKYQDGVLILTVPKTKKHKSKSVEIQ